MHKIIFCAPGLGKSYLVKNLSEEYVDCDSVIEHATGRKVSEISWTNDWAHAKSMILIWWQQYFPDKHLLVGKDRYIKDADVVYLHKSPEVMKQRLASLDRENPITDWNCEIKDAEYTAQALRYGKKICRIDYLSDVVK